MIKTYKGKLTAPEQGNADPAEKGHKFVTAVLATFKTHVAHGPHCVKRMHSFRFTKHIVEGNLELNKYIPNCH